MKDWFETDSNWTTGEEGIEQISEERNSLDGLKDTMNRQCEKAKPHIYLNNLSEELDYLEHEIKSLSASPQVYRAMASILRVKAILMEVDAWES